MKKWWLVIGGLALTLGAVAATRPPHFNTVDLIWEADTYTPPFYEGHSLPSSESLVKVVAMPDLRNSNGAALKTEQLNFQWQKDGKNIVSLSGLGKNVLIYTAETTGGSNRVSVLVTTVDNKIRVEKTLELAVQNQRLILYEDEPLMGVNYQAAVAGAYNLTKPEVSLVAEPFFFSRGDVERRNLDYNWQLNGQKVISDAANPALITLAAPTGGASGSNDLTVQVKNKNKVLQTAQNNLTVKFNQHELNF